MATSTDVAIRSMVREAKSGEAPKSLERTTGGLNAVGEDQRKSERGPSNRYSTAENLGDALDTDIIEIRVNSTSHGTVNDSRIDRGRHPTVHEALLAAAVDIARETGQSCLAHAIDTVDQEDWWVTVHPDGTSTPALDPEGAPAPSMIRNQPLREPAGGNGAAPPSPALTTPKATTTSPGDIEVTNPPRPAATLMAQKPAAAPLPGSVGATTVQPAIYRPRPPAPEMGFPAVVYRASGGLINMGPGKREITELDLIRRIRAPLPGGRKWRFASWSLKGGIGKTTVLTAIMKVAAYYRADNPLLVDANPDDGDASLRVTGDRSGGLTPLLRDINEIKSSAALSRYCVTDDRLTLLPGEPSPQLGQGMAASDFDTVMDVVETYHQLIGIDTGEGVTRPIMSGIFNRIDGIVIAAGHSETGARSAIRSLDWLRSNDFQDLADNAVVALSAKDGVSKAVDTGAAIAEVAARCRNLVVIPADPHLADGAKIELSRFAPETRKAFMEAAASLADSWSVIDSQSA